MYYDLRIVYMYYDLRIVYMYYDLRIVYMYYDFENCPKRPTMGLLTSIII